MTSLLPADVNGGPVRGSRWPRIRTVPPGAVRSSKGEDAVGLAELAGLELDPWQADGLQDACAERSPGRWAAFEVAFVLPRQNGKGAIITARELAGIREFREPLVVHTSHEVKTNAEAFLKAKTLVDGCDYLRRAVKRVNTGRGEELIEMLPRYGGGRLKFIARKFASGRGFSGSTVFLDEAFKLGEIEVNSLFPTMSAMPNPQLWYLSSAVNQEEHPQGRVLARVRRRGIAGSPRLVYLEWSADADGLDDAARVALRTDRRAWAQSNPAYGIRISEEFILAELEAMTAKGFDVERLGIGDWPSDEAEQWRVIGEADWLALAVAASDPEDPVAFAAAVASDRTAAAIAVAGRRADGLLHVQVTDYRPGTDWVVPRLVELDAKWRPCGIAIDEKGPSGTLIIPAEQAGLKIDPKPNAGDVAVACGRLFDACRPDQRSLRHLNQPVLNRALGAAGMRPLGDAWAWAYRDVDVDMSPLNAVTLAAWAHAVKAGELADPEIWVI